MLLEVKNVVVHYGKSLVLDGVSIAVPEGSVVCIIGANGAGKSTLLRAISGLLKITQGEIWFLGQRIDHKSVTEIVRLGLSHVPEGRWLFPYLSVSVNLMLGSSVRNDRDEIGKDMERVYNLFPVLQQKRDQKAGSLSGGIQQMLAIGRALMARPKLLLMDEPSLGLAPMVVKSLSQVIRDMKRAGISILLAEQNIPLALGVADKVYALQTGRVVMEGGADKFRSAEMVKAVYFKAGMDAAS